MVIMITIKSMTYLPAAKISWSLLTGGLSSQVVSPHMYCL